jgi:glycosyltransferase involved in cell wall biosynthesis
MVSVIIPCYNQAHFLPEAVASVMAQTYSNWECIIVNDGSTDDTGIVAKELCAKDARIKYIFKNNGGLSAARNTGIENATGKYILPLDADDLIMPTYLQVTFDAIESDYNIRLIYTGTQLFGTETGVRNEPFDLSKFMLTNLIPCTALYYRADWEKVKGYNEAMKLGYEDWDFWMMLFENAVQVKKIEALLFKYRRTGVSMSNAMDANIILQIQEEMYKRHCDLYLSVLGNPLMLSLRIEAQQRELNLIKQSGAFKLAKKISAILKFKIF